MTAARARRYGDVLVLDTTPRLLAVACDTCGGIGPKPADHVRVSGQVVGRFACRVPLMELLALGADPEVVVVCLCVEPAPTGEQILEGVRAELEAAGLAGRVALTGSSEKNFPTASTGVGLSVLGWLDKPRWGLAEAGDLVVAVGEPSVGEGVTLEDPRIADVPTLRAALRCGGAGDVVPVGSRGAGAEARDLAGRSGCVFRPGGGGPGAGGASPFDLEASGGPATCFLVTCPPDGVGGLREGLAGTGRPVRVIGRLEPGRDCARREGRPSGEPVG